jgi:DNA-binding NtrC family response regulator
MSWPDDSLSAPNRTPPPLFGREREGAVFREYLRAAQAGRGSLVLIGGEAGIGKTALAETVCGEARKKAAAWVREHVGSSIESVERHEGESVWDVRAG